jgi:polyhydroxybutyrate depolymerase
MLAGMRAAWLLGLLGSLGCGGDDAPVTGEDGGRRDTGMVGVDGGGGRDVGPDRDAFLPDATAGGPCTDGPPFRGEMRRTLVWDGVMREYLIHIPDALPTTPVPLVLNFHAYRFDAVQHSRYTQMREAADARGFVAVHPDGVSESWNGESCCGTAESTGVDDLGFVDALIDEVMATVCIDERRVYASGFSNGGFLSHRLACELSDRIAAIGTVAGPDGTTTPCTASNRVGVLHIHGESDLIVPYDGGFLFPRGATETFMEWGERNGCTGTPAETFAMGDARCVAFPTCEGGVTTELCTITGGGHTWPGATETISPGHMSMDLDATARILDHFDRHVR